MPEENYCDWHWLSGQNCEDGPEVGTIRREEINSFVDWVESLPERWEQVWKNCEEFVRKWNPDVR